MISKGAELAFTGEYTDNKGSGTNFKNLSYAMLLFLYKPLPHILKTAVFQ